MLLFGRGDKIQTEGLAKVIWSSFELRGRLSTLQLTINSKKAGSKLILNLVGNSEDGLGLSHFKLYLKEKETY